MLCFLFLPHQLHLIYSWIGHYKWWWFNVSIVFVLPHFSLLYNYFTHPYSIFDLLGNHKIMLVGDIQDKNSAITLLQVKQSFHGVHFRAAGYLWLVFISYDNRWQCYVQNSHLEIQLRKRMSWKNCDKKQTFILLLFYLDLQISR